MKGVNIATKKLQLRRLHKKLVELNRKPKKRIPTRATKSSKY